MKHRIALAGVFAAVLVTAACSGSAGSSGTSSAAPTSTTTSAAASADPVKWAGTFCAGISPTIEGVLELLQVMLGGETDPAAQKQALLDYATKSGTSMAEAGAKLEDLGAPSPDTQALHDELVKFFTDSGKSLNTASEELAKLDPNDPEFATKLEQLGGDEADPSKLQEQIKKLQDDPKLGAAFKEAPECVAMSEKLKGLGG
ncbi:hypothetical protein ACQPZF_01720 [Actinosynnema sp. CS-041913]|uniref:hypothetical protein n=1 Tax=Actinosynnema sp. CS-041913 TaxID=3239917 RepID=UPI003D89B40F